MYLRKLSGWQFAVLVALIAAGSFSAPFLIRSSKATKPTSLDEPRCDIKGNVSIDTGERIYHMIGQERYSETVISPQYGERWFCSEADAIAAGWRKAKR